MHPSPDFQDVKAFHAKFGQPLDDGSGTGALMDYEQFEFRRKFLLEEFDELGVAYNKGNLIKAADALFDFVYVACGTVLFMRATWSFFPTMPFPSFVRVRDQAVRLGFLVRPPAVTDPVPMFLTSDMQQMFHRRISHELETFFYAHQDLRHIPIALSHLWNAARAAYLVGVMMNIPWSNCWQHVQKANMLKVRAKKDGSDSARGSGWDVVKPKGWRGPDRAIADELIARGARIDDDHLEEATHASQPKE